MKTKILVAVIAILSLTPAFSQKGNFTVGVNAGIPVGDAEELTTLNLGADVAYRFSLSEKFEVGGLLAYSHFFGETLSDSSGTWELEVEDVQFMPVAASARFNAGSFFAGGDIGYAVGISEDNDGGLYYRPHAGYSFGKFGVVASYAGITKDNFTVASVNLGVEIKL